MFTPIAGPTREVKRIFFFSQKKNKIVLKFYVGDVEGERIVSAQTVDERNSTLLRLSRRADLPVLTRHFDGSECDQDIEWKRDLFFFFFAEKVFDIVSLVDASNLIELIIVRSVANVFSVMIIIVLGRKKFLMNDFQWIFSSFQDE